MNISEEFPLLEKLDISQMETYYQDQITQFYFLLTRKNCDDEIDKLACKLNDLLSSIKKSIHNENQIYVKYLILLYKMIAQTRDIVYGKGERKITYMMISIFYKYYPVLAIYAIHRLVDLRYLPKSPIPIHNINSRELENYLKSYLSSSTHSFGCWKDIKYFCYHVCKTSRKRFGDPLIEIATSIMNQQLLRDWKIVNICKNNTMFLSELRDYISFVAKWVPRENTKFEWVFEKLAMDWAQRTTPFYFKDNLKRYDYQHERLMNKCKMNYRKVISELNQILETVEVKQCSQKWGKIIPDKIPIGTIFKFKDSLLNVNGKFEERKKTKFNNDRRICSQQIKEYYKDLNNPDNEFYGFHYEMGYYVKSANKLLLHSFNNNTDIEIMQNRLYQMDLLNKQMKSFLKRIHGMEGFIPFLDFCNDGNGEFDYFHSAIELAYIISVKSAGKFMMVDHSPHWCELIKNNDYQFMDNMEKILISAKPHTNYLDSNILDSIDIYIKSLVDANIDNESIGKMVLVIITNKEYVFDNVKDMDLYDKISLKFSNISLNIPHILFWNLSTKSHDTFPIMKCLQKTTMISGMNTSLLNHFRFMNFGNVNQYSAFDTICNILNHSKFDVMEEYIKSFLHI
jgi:hypothetical protein